MVTTNKNTTVAAIRELLGQVNDPEVPVLSILDLGIVRDIRVNQPAGSQPVPDLPEPRQPESGHPAGHTKPHQSAGQPEPPQSGAGPEPAAPGPALPSVEVIITPTYSGCPAMDMIRTQIQMVLAEHGYKDVRITTVLSPAWTTEWMSEAGKDKLKAYGIAPPNPLQQVCQIRPFHREEAVQCPHCGSYHTSLISEFGSTACKALYRCEGCKEPFDYFKCH